MSMTTLQDTDCHKTLNYFWWIEANSQPCGNCLPRLHSLLSLMHNIPFQPLNTALIIQNISFWQKFSSLFFSLVEIWLHRVYLLSKMPAGSCLWTTKLIQSKTWKPCTMIRPRFCTQTWDNLLRPVELFHRWNTFLKRF